MIIFWRHLRLAAGVGLVVLATRQEVRAQFIQRGFRAQGPLSINQAAFNQALTGQVNPGVSPVSQFPFRNPLFNPFANPIANPFVNPALNPAIDPRSLNNFFSPGAAFQANPLINPFTSPATNPIVAASLSNSLTNPFGAGGLSNPYAGGVSPYGGGLGGGVDPYGSSYYETPIGGFLRGTADIVSSQGKWMESLQRADLAKEQVRQAKLATRGKTFDEYFYERRNTPTFEQERKFFQGQQLLRSLNNPPETEVWSGQALNDILADLAKSDPDKAQGPNVPLDEDMLRHLNLTPANGNANAGLLKNDARLTWPLALRDDDSKTDRTSVNSLAAEAVHQAINGRVDAGTLRELSAAAGRLRQRLAANVRDLTANQYAEANHFLGDLDDAIRALGRPDAGDYFTRKYAAEGKDVAELVKGLSARGLRFAPATAGDEAAYLAVHRALATYDQGANTRLAREIKPDTTKSAEDSSAREKPREERYR
jgi:hypothetical protein